jgi:hypothetical protein
LTSVKNENIMYEKYRKRFPKMAYDPKEKTHRKI